MPQAALSESFGPTIPLPTNEPPLLVEEVGSIGMLLKSPKNFARLVSEDRVEIQPSLILTISSLGLYALYGLAMGCFASGNSIWQATLKSPLILLGTFAVTAPSLYLMLALSGVHVTRRQVLAILAGVAGTSSVILAGMSPVAWLFSLSTRCLPFMVLFHAGVWCLALCAGLGFAVKTQPGTLRERKAVLLWAGLFLLVSAQVTTFFRPILGVTVTKEFRENKRTFFAQHFVTCMVGERPVPTDAPPVPLSAPAPIFEPGLIPPPTTAPMSN